MAPEWWKSSPDPERPAFDESKVLKLGPYEGVVLAS